MKVSMQCDSAADFQLSTFSSQLFLYDYDRYYNSGYCGCRCHIGLHERLYQAVGFHFGLDCRLAGSQGFIYLFGRKTLSYDNRFDDRSPDTCYCHHLDCRAADFYFGGILADKSDGSCLPGMVESLSGKWLGSIEVPFACQLGGLRDRIYRSG